LVLHELWVDGDGLDTFCLAGSMGCKARELLSDEAKLVWTVKASSHFEAMSKYYKYRGYGDYTVEHDLDMEPYPEEWLEYQKTNN